tara:strand:- start:206 stop:805 length:600 start_codon:yes stop_codon:yes gene_type:complete
MANGTLKVSNIETSSGSGTITLGQSGETISVPSGATINLSNATQTGVGGNLTPAFSVHRGSTQTISDATWTKVNFDTEVLDSDGTYDNSTNYRFTPASTGYYLLSCNISLTSTAGTNAMGDNYAAIYKNGTSHVISQNYGNTSNHNTWGQHSLSVIVHADNASDYYEVYAYADMTSGNVEAVGNGTKQYSSFNGFKLIL